jgi:hypothetical protein
MLKHVVTVALVAGVAVVAGMAIGAGRPGSDPKPAIEKVLDALHDAAAKADGERYFALFGRDAVFLGTDASERWTIEQFREYATPHFDAGTGWTYHVRKRNVSITDDHRTAWFDEDLVNEKYGTCRGTGVLVRRDDAWKIVQYSLSIPVPNDLALDVVEMIRKLDDTR